jgi:hypothetical protein
MRTNLESEKRAPSPHPSTRPLRNMAMEHNSGRPSPPPVWQFLRSQLRYTVLPCLGFPAAIFLLLVVYPPAAIFLFFIAFVYLLPAWIIVNFGFGHQTVGGAPPLPIPASSPASWLILLATHAALVSVIFGAHQLGIRRRQRATEPGPKPPFPRD